VLDHHAEAPAADDRSDDPHRVEFVPECVEPDPHCVEPQASEAPPESKSTAAARRIVPTFESEVEPESPRAPARLLNIPAAIRPTKARPAPKRPVEGPVRWPYDIDLGSFESLCGDPASHRVMFPVANANRGRVRLEQEVEVAEIQGVSPTGGHLQITLAAGYRIGGTYPIKVIVECKGKTTVGKADIVFKHKVSHVFTVSAALGGRSEAEVPYAGQLWKAATFTAHFEPPLQEFHLTNTKGTMNAGATTFPFKIIFTPKDPKPVTTLLVVVFDAAEEVAVEIVGNTGIAGHLQPTFLEAQSSAE
jgi:hypothetical protein